MVTGAGLLQNVWVGPNARAQDARAETGGGLSARGLCSRLCNGDGDTSGVRARLESNHLGTVRGLAPRGLAVAEKKKKWNHISYLVVE